MIWMYGHIHIMILSQVIMKLYMSGMIVHIKMNSIIKFKNEPKRRPH